MAKRIVQSPQAMKALVGQELGVSDWLGMAQERIKHICRSKWLTINGFMLMSSAARRTCRMGRPSRTVNLTLAVIAYLQPGRTQIDNVRNGINYGSNKVRFTNPVQVGARIRGRQKLLAADDMPNGGIRMTYEWTVEIEGKERPACVAETMSIVYAKT